MRKPPMPIAHKFKKDSAGRKQLSAVVSGGKKHVGRSVLQLGLLREPKKVLAFSRTMFGQKNSMEEQKGARDPFFPTLCRV